MSLLGDEEIVALVDTLKPDAVIADEIHVFKTREMKTESKVELKQRNFSLIAERIQIEWFLAFLELSLLTH